MREEEFKKIIEDALSRARKVNCPIDDFRNGLRAWLETIQEEIYLSE